MVIWRDAPRSILKMKNIANWPSLNRVKALRPKASARDSFFLVLSMGHLGIVRA